MKIYVLTWQSKSGGCRQDTADTLDEALDLIRKLMTRGNAKGVKLDIYEGPSH